MGGWSRWRVLLAAGLLLVVGDSLARASQSDPGPVPPPRAPFQVLMVTATADYYHESIPLARTVVQRLGEESGKLRVDFLSDVSQLRTLSAELLAPYDVLLFASTSGELPLEERQREALRQFVARGGGFAGVHSASATLYTWPEYGQMLGAYFHEHPWVQEATINVEDQQHPSTRALGTSFRLLEELYTFRANPRSHVHVLLSLDAASVGATGDYPLAWCTRYGEGRVFYTALGHFDSTWNDPRFQQHLLGGLEWAADRSAPSEPAGSCG